MTFLKKPLKILLWILLALIIILGLAAFALVKLVNPNDFKPQIISAVNNATGRQLSLPGELSWTFYPEVGIRIGEAALSNPPGFNTTTFAKIDSANLAVSFWGLLQGKLQFDTLNLNGLEIYLIQDQKRNNWTFASSSDNVSNTLKQAQTKNNNTKYAVSIEAIEITNGSIRFDNYQNNSHYALSAINLNARNVGLNHSFPINLATNYDINQDMTGSFKLDAYIKFDEDKNTLLAKNFELTNTMIYPTASNNLKINTDLAGNIEANLNTETITTDELDLDINQVLKGQISNLTINNFATPKFSGVLSTSSFNLNDLLTSFNLSPLPVQNKNLIKETSLQTQFTGTTNTLNLNNLTINMGNSQLLANINVRAFSPLNLTETLKINQLDLADFFNIKGARLPMQNISSSGNINMSEGAYPSALNGNINLNIQTLTLQGFDLQKLINSLANVVKSLKNLPGLASASSQLQQQMQQIMGSQSINPNNGQQTDLGSLTAKINIRQGVITTPTMLLQGPVVIVNGTGKVDLPDQSINYELDAHVPQTGDPFLQGLTIPYQIQGKFGNISQGLNWIVLQAEILKYLLTQIQQTVQSTVKQVVEQSVQQIQNGTQGVSDVGNAAAKALNSIFGGSN